MSTSFVKIQQPIPMNVCFLWEMTLGIRKLKAILFYCSHLTPFQCRCLSLILKLLSLASYDIGKFYLPESPALKRPCRSKIKYVIKTNKNPFIERFQSSQIRKIVWRNFKGVITIRSSTTALWLWLKSF